MKVKEVMTQNPVVVMVTDTVRDAAKILRQKTHWGITSHAG
jgi:CBS domain-containing protein